MIQRNKDANVSHPLSPLNTIVVVAVIVTRWQEQFVVQMTCGSHFCGSLFAEHQLAF